MKEMDNFEKQYVCHHLSEAIKHLDKAMDVLVKRGDQKDFLIISPVSHIVTVVAERVADRSE